MPVPGSSQIQFDVAHGRLHVESITDPNGNPRNVLDVDLGFVISGRVTLPNWLEGTGQVCVYAQEIGGPFNQSIGCDNSLKFTRPVPAEPGPNKQPWTVTVPPNSNVLPDPQPGASQVYNLIAVFVFDDQLTDIGAFVELGTFMIN
jgi:hypothetical protein